LTEPHWVSLRLADQFDGDLDADGLALAVADRAHVPNAVDHVDALAARGLLDDGRLTTAGHRLLESMQAMIAETTAPIWQGLDDSDVTATTRLLHEVVARARRVLDSTH
jgi:hypothetical protein